MAYLVWSIHTNGPCSTWSISHLIADIQDLTMSFVSCNFSWISRCRNSNDKIDDTGDLLTQGSIASGGPLTQGSVASGCNEIVHKVEPFSSLG